MNVQRLKAIEAVMVGASAGGIDALLKILKGLPSTYRLPIVIVLHLPENRESRLPELFSHHLAIPVKEAIDKDVVAGRNVYFAGPGYHLSIEKDRTFSLSCEPPVFFSRPSIDFLMESAAQTYGPAAVGILLTGANQDGATGLQCIAESGGVTVVQDPNEARMATMPQAALAQFTPDLILTLQEIHDFLVALEHN